MVKLPKKLRITSFTYDVDGVPHTARLATPEEVKAAGLTTNDYDYSCTCGSEACVDGWVYRCMAGGGGQCYWYATNEVC